MKGNNLLLTVVGLAARIGGVSYFWKDIASPALKRKPKVTDADPAVAATAEETARFTGTAVAPASFITTAEASYDTVNQRILQQGTY